MSLLERVAYYGVRGILVLFALDESGLNFDKTKAFEFYGILTMLLVILPIPFGLITDKLLGQAKSIYLGGLITFVAYLLFMVTNTITLYISIVLLAIGISFVKPSTTILVGRQFIKEDRYRTLAYILFFFGINLGAFIGSLTIGYAGEIYGWNWAFLIAALTTVIYLLLFRLFSSKIVQKETNQLKELNTTISYKTTLPILIIFILLYMVFTKCSEALITSYTIQIANSDDKTLLGFDMFDSIIHTITSLWSIPLTIAILIYWKVKGIGKAFNLIALSILILLVSLIISTFSTRINLDYVLDYAMVQFGLYALADVIVLPLITSYSTRLADVNYSNTTYAMFIFLTHIIGGGLIYLIINDYQNIIIAIVLILTLCLMIGFRKQIRKLTYGIE